MRLRWRELSPEDALIIKTGFGDIGRRMWSFAAMMFLITLKPGRRAAKCTVIFVVTMVTMTRLATSNHDNPAGSMDLVAGHTLSISIATLIFANSIGTLIDRITRLTAIRVAIGGQIAAVAVIAIMILGVQIKGDILTCVPTELYSVFTILCICDICSKLAKEAAGIIIGRDWMVTVVGGDRARLARLNVWVTRIDEFFGICYLRQVLTMLQTTIIGSIGYLVCMLVQYSLIMYVYRRVEGIRYTTPPASITESRESSRLSVMISSPDSSIIGGSRENIDEEPLSPPPPYTEKEEEEAASRGRCGGRGGGRGGRGGKNGQTREGDKEGEMKGEGERGGGRGRGRGRGGKREAADSPGQR
eukprot:sb/3466052/